MKKWIYIPIAALSVGILAGGVRLWNNFVNNRRESYESYYLVSRAEGLGAHTEMIVNRIDRTLELRKYDEWNNNKIYRGSAQNGWKVDTIQEERNLLFLGGLDKMLIRAIDYEDYKKEFDKADSEIISFLADEVYK